MKEQLEKLSQLALQSASTVGQSLTNVPNLVQNLGVQVAQVAQEAESRGKVAASMALAAGETVRQAVTDVIKHENTQAIIEQVKEKSLQIAEGANDSARTVGTHLLEGVKKLDENHLEIKEKTETLSMGMGIVAGVAAGAAIVGPPLAVAAAPVIATAATVTGAVAGGVYFYSKWKVKKSQENQDDTE